MRILVLAGLALLLVLFLSASGIARLYTDWLWFSNLELGSVWQTLLGTRLALAAVFTAIFFAIMWTNLYLADRLAPDFRPVTPEEDLIERYHQLVDGHIGRIRIGLAAVFALVAGADTATRWKQWLLFRNGEDFGWADPMFGRDASFYVFRLPFWTFLVDWFFWALVFTLVISLMTHYLNGGIRASGGPVGRVTSGVKLHLSIMMAVLAVLRAVAYYLDRFELVNGERGVYDGALATDVQIQLPALNLLALISLFGAGLFVGNIWRKGWGLPMVALGLWAVSHIVVGSAFPALYQRLRVEPEESVREAMFIGRNIDATRYAYGLGEDDLTVVPYDYRAGLTEEDVAGAEDIIEDVSVVDRSLTAEAFQVTEAERNTYKFTDRLDLDRYNIDGDIEPVVLAVRNLNLEGVTAGWEREHVAFTHGYAVAVAAADQTAPGGLPDYLVKGIGPDLQSTDGFAELTRPQVYFAEDLGGYAVVGATRNEVDYVAAGEVPFRYDGTGGVPMGGIINRAAFALRFQALEPLISQFITGDSEVIFNRDIEDRVRELAPFLEYDSDPYPVVADGQIYWVIDAYTTTNDFPYAQKVSGGAVPAGADLSSGYNYVRNSVKAVIDGYDGDVSFYISDPDDPIVNAYSKAFPDLFSDMDEMPESLLPHVKYPVDIFKVQTDVYSTYQVDDPVQFLEGALSWKIADQPSTNAGDTEATANVPMEPQYRTTRLPDETATEFVVQRAFVPASSDSGGRPLLTGVLVARSDPENYGQLVQYEFSRAVVQAPDLVDSDIRKESEISAFITLRADQGSRVRFGEMQVVLLDDTLIYVRPLYIQADATNAVPELDQVIVVSGSEIAMEPTLGGAITEILTGRGSVTPGPADPGTPETDPGTDVPVDPGELPEFSGQSVAQLLGFANEYLAAADAADARGDIEGATEFRAQAQAALDELAEVLGVEVTTPVVAETGEA